MRYKLLHYLEQTYGSHGEAALRKFAKDVASRSPRGGASYGGVRKWVTGEREPRYSTRIKIQKLSRGQISLMDW